MFVKSAAALTAVLLTAGSAHAQQTNPIFDDVVSFGDSQSDIGNASAVSLGSGVYLSYTVNPGHTTVEQVADHYGIATLPSIAGGHNYSYGGQWLRYRPNLAIATFPNTVQMAGQIARYLAANPAIGPNTLITYWGGANDMVDINARVGIGYDSREKALVDAADVAIEALHQLSLLQDAGAKTIIVINHQRSRSLPVGADLSFTFNQVLSAGLAGRTGIVPVNSYALYRNFVTTPAAYGFKELLIPSCTVPIFSCTTATLVEPGADQTYLMADSVHPGPAAATMTAQVTLSELVAPQQISLLAETPLAFSAGHRAGVRGSGDAPLFASLTALTQQFDASYDVDKADDDGLLLTVGGSFHVTPDLLLGAAFSAGHTTNDFGSSGGHATRAVLGSVFGRYAIGDAGYVTADAFSGELRFRDINRSFALGPTVRIERGRTEGEIYGASLGGGWWFGGETLRHGPVVEVNAQRVQVGRYAEGPTSDPAVIWGGTAMIFGDQVRDSMVTSIGYQVKGEAQVFGATITPYGSLAYANESEGEGRVVTAGLVSMNGTFSMPAFAPSGDWAQVRAGVGFTIIDGITGSVGYEGRIGGETSDQHVLSVSVRRAL